MPSRSPETGTIAVPAPRRGRPRTRDLPEKRDQQIRIVGLVFAGVLSKREAAAAYGCEVRTVNRWIAEFLSDGEPDTEGLRRYAEDRDR